MKKLGFSGDNLLVGTTDSSLYNNTTGVGVAIHDNHIQVARSSGVPLYLNRQTSDGTIAEFRKDGSTVGSIGTYSGLTVGHGDVGLVFSAGGDTILPFNQTANTLRDNAIGLGDATRRFKDLHLGGTAYVGAITSSGNLTFSPSGDYYAGLSSTNALHFENGTGQTLMSTASVNIRIDANNSDTTRFFSVSSHSTDIETWRGTELFRVQEDGKVGIGTSSPDRKLTVSGTLGIGIDDYIVHNGDSNTFFGFNGLDSWKVRTGGGDRLVIGNDDSNFNTNLGIGTSSPGEKLTVSGNTLTYGSTGNVGAGTSYFLGNSQNSRDIALTRVGSATLGIGYYSGGWQESARFTNGGEFYVGTTNGQTTNSNITTKAAINGDVFTNGIRFNTNTTQAINTVPSYKLWNDGGDLI